MIIKDEELEKCGDEVRFDLEADSHEVYRTTPHQTNASHSR